MKADKETIRKIAHLSRLDFEEKAEADMVADLNRILDWVDQLDAVDTSGVEPLIHMSEEINLMRDDRATPSLPHEQGLVNAPKKDSDYFRVPKVLE